MHHQAGALCPPRETGGRGLAYVNIANSAEWGPSGRLACHGGPAEAVEQTAATAEAAQDTTAPAPSGGRAQLWLRPPAWRQGTTNISLTPIRLLFSFNGSATCPNYWYSKFLARKTTFAGRSAKRRMKYGYQASP